MTTKDNLLKIFPSYSYGEITHSLKIELRDCKSQAQITAEVMEFERLDEKKKKATK